MKDFRSTRGIRWRAVLLGTAACVLAIPAAVFAHAVVFPKASTPGAYERYVLRVPNEKSVATTKVELRFPSDVRVTSFSDVPGWQLEVTRDSAQRIVGATWTGTLPPERFVEFPFVAVNPKTATQVSWPTYQTYADGQTVEWTGAEGSKAPASVTAISASTSAGGGGGSQSTFVLAVAALALAVVSLGLSMRKRD
jgi:YD repeat-containing protein